MMYLRSRTPIYPDGKLKILGKLAEADFSITHKPMLSTKYLVQMGYRWKAKPKTDTLGPLDWSDYVTGDVTGPNKKRRPKIAHFT